MPNSKLHLEAEMADGSAHQLVADQRDFAKWERNPLAETGARLNWVRFLAWSVMSRDKLTKADFDKFSELDCVEARVTDQPDSEGEQGLDPGPKEAGTASTSRQRAERDSRSPK